MTREEVSRELDRCSRCGSCMAVCPIYRETGDECGVARGKLGLMAAMARDELRFSAVFRQLLETCLLCGACSHHCPNGVQADKLVQWQRARLTEDHGASLGVHLLANTLKVAGRWPRLLSRGGSIAQALLCEKIPSDSGLHLRFPLAILSRRSYLPGLRSTAFLSEISSRIRGCGPRVGLFVGCAGNYLDTRVSELSLELLRRCGFTVLVPTEQRCCGMPAWASGERKTARALAEHNSRIFLDSGCEWVVSACGTCSTHLRFGMPDLLQNSDPAAAGFFSRRSMDLTVFLARKLLPAELRSALTSPGSLLVSHHDPCHLLYRQGVRHEPRQILALLAGVELRELPGPHQCCGHGGMFNVEHYRLSSLISARKRAQVDAVGPEVLTTSCMGCLFQLQEARQRHGAGWEVRHLVEVLMGKGAS